MGKTKASKVKICSLVVWRHQRVLAYTMDRLSHDLIDGLDTKLHSSLTVFIFAVRFQEAQESFFIFAKAWNRLFVMEKLTMMIIASMQLLSLSLSLFRLCPVNIFNSQLKKKSLKVERLH